jgi:hypothetical protein
MGSVIDRAATAASAPGENNVELPAAADSLKRFSDFGKAHLRNWILSLRTGARQLYRPA